MGKWVEIPAYECCNPVYTTTTTAILPLRLLFSNITEVDAIIGDSSNVSDWNTYFDLPTYGAPFTSVSVTGDEVKLYGGSNIIIKEELFDQPDELGTYLLEVDDTAGCIIEVEYDGFGNDQNSGCQNLILINLPTLIIAGDYAFSSAGLTASSTLVVSLPLLSTVGENCFYYCNLLETISLPSATFIGQQAFETSSSDLISISIPSCTNLGGTVGNNFVFNGIIGNTITLTVPTALMTCDAGSPDGDIVYLQANNTVTIVTV